MLKDLFYNITTIIAVISIGNQILINEEITPSSPLKLRLFFSSMAGVLGILLMVNRVQVMSGVILDFQNIAIILSATYCGFVAALMTGLIIGGFQLVYVGLNYSSVITAITVILTGIGCGLIAKYTTSKLKTWVLMSVYVVIILSLSYVVLIENQWILLETITTYGIGTAVASTLLYLFIRHLDLSRFLYRKYQTDSIRDHRTGLNNVRQFDNELNKIMNRLTAQSIITLLFIDIDFFKKINDNYGHQNGDKVLEDLGKILLSSCSFSDILSRNGGDEFSVLMTDCPRDKVLEVAERIRSGVQEHKFYLINGQIITITVSIGVAIYPDTVRDIHKIVEQADWALYEAKQAGRNRVFMEVPAL